MKFLYYVIAIMVSAQHIWTFIISCLEDGLSPLLSFFLPVVSQIYWFIKMYNIDTTYITYSIITFILLAISFFVYSDSNKN